MITSKIAWQLRVALVSAIACVGLAACVVTTGTPGMGGGTSTGGGRPHSLACHHPPNKEPRRPACAFAG